MGNAASAAGGAGGNGLVIITEAWGGLRRLIFKPLDSTRDNEIGGGDC